MARARARSARVRTRRERSRDARDSRRTGSRWRDTAPRREISGRASVPKRVACPLERCHQPVSAEDPLPENPSLTSFVPLLIRSQMAGAKRGELQVRAARVAGVEIPNNKRAETALTYVYGIGDTTAKKIMAETGLENKRLREFEEEELTTLRAEVDKYMIEGDLRRFNMMNIKRLKEIQCYRGRRHIQGLPMRGQRTKTNARTRKGKVKTVAGKKK